MSFERPDYVELVFDDGSLYTMWDVLTAHFEFFAEHSNLVGKDPVLDMSGVDRKAFQNFLTYLNEGSDIYLDRELADMVQIADRFDFSGYRLYDWIERLGINIQGRIRSFEDLRDTLEIASYLEEVDKDSGIWYDTYPSTNYRGRYVRDAISFFNEHIDPDYALYEYGGAFSNPDKFDPALALEELNSGMLEPYLKKK